MKVGEERTPSRHERRLRTVRQLRTGLGELMTEGIDIGMYQRTVDMTTARAPTVGPIPGLA